MQIITVHGIRRQEKWYEKFKKLDHWENTNIAIENFEYGYLTMGQFLNPIRRKKVILEFQQFYSSNFNPSNPPSIICHSFGTYIFYTTIRKYKSIKFDKVILCGSILTRKVNWKPFLDSNQINFLVNDYGPKDNVVKYSRLVLFRVCGTTGQKGFHNLPTEHFNRILQRKNPYFEHSDYFLPLNMTENWAKLFIPAQKQFQFKRDILRKEIIDRIYANICNKNIEYTLVTYKARIDDRGNYFAHYIKEGYNRSTNELNELILTTTADSTSTEEKMWFTAFDLKNAIIQTNIKNDSIQNKSFLISFSNSIAKDRDFGVQCRFRWKETIDVIKGDTDHFIIIDAKNVFISLNFKYTLKSPKFLVLKDRLFVDEIAPVHTTEKDGTSTYWTQYKNSANNDGMIFYFEGSMMPLVKKPRKALTGKKLSSGPNVISISKCSQEQIKDVYQIEVGIELSNAASETTLKQRLAMFEDGFLIAKENDEVVGYIESVIWHDKEFETFEEIKRFPLHYDITGDTLYIIFLGVRSDKRKKGIGQSLIEALEKIAIKYGMKQIKLVAKDDLICYYGKFGFQQVRELPHFLNDTQYKSVLMMKQL